MIITVTTISLILISLLAAMTIYMAFLLYRRRYRHANEILKLREYFSQVLLQSKLEIQEHTLNHISKELHANFSHLVSLININLSEILPQSSKDTKETILETKSLAKQLMSEIKNLSVSLNTDYTIQIGFLKALENEVHRLSKTKKYQVSFLKLGDECRLPPEHEIILFRLCQEVLNNIVKHARASSIKVVITYSSSYLLLEITDDGIGFNVQSAKLQSGEKESTGLLNIEKRAKLINANFSIFSEKEEGTVVKIKIPLNN